MCRGPLIERPGKVQCPACALDYDCQDGVYVLGPHFALNGAARQTIVTREELAALRDDLLTSAEPPRGTRRLQDWLAENRSWLGKQLASGEHRAWGK